MMEFLKDPDHFLRHIVPSKWYFMLIQILHQHNPNTKENKPRIRFLRDLLIKRNKFLHNEICDCEFCRGVYEILGLVNNLDN